MLELANSKRWEYMKGLMRPPGYKSAKLNAHKNLLLFENILQVQMKFKDKENGKICLHYAVESRDTQLVNMILNAYPGGKFIKDNSSLTPVDYAMSDIKALFDKQFETLAIGKQSYGKVERFGTSANTVGLYQEGKAYISCTVSDGSFFFGCDTDKTKKNCEVEVQVHDVKNDNGGYFHLMVRNDTNISSPFFSVCISVEGPSVYYRRDRGESIVKESTSELFDEGENGSGWLKLWCNGNEYRALYKKKAADVYKLIHQNAIDISLMSNEDAKIGVALSLMPKAPSATPKFVDATFSHFSYAESDATKVRQYDFRSTWIRGINDEPKGHLITLFDHDESFDDGRGKNSNNENIVNLKIDQIFETEMYVNGGSLSNASNDAVLFHGIGLKSTNFEVSVRLNEEIARGEFGIMIRDDLEVSSSYIFAFFTHDGAYAKYYDEKGIFHYQRNFGEADLSKGKLKIVRKGDLFSCYVYGNRSFIPISTGLIEMRGDIQVGVAHLSANGASNVKFSDFKLSCKDPSNNLLVPRVIGTNVGSGIISAADYESEQDSNHSYLKIKQSGEIQMATTVTGGLDNDKDSIFFNSIPVNRNNFDLLVTVKDWKLTTHSPEFGLMIRDSLEENANYFCSKFKVFLSEDGEKSSYQNYACYRNSGSYSEGTISDGHNYVTKGSTIVLRKVGKRISAHFRRPHENAFIFLHEQEMSSNFGMNEVYIGVMMNATQDANLTMKKSLFEYKDFEFKTNDDDIGTIVLRSKAIGDNASGSIGFPNYHLNTNNSELMIQQINASRLTASGSTSFFHYTEWDANKNFDAFVTIKNHVSPSNGCIISIMARKSLDDNSPFVHSFLFYHTNRWVSTGASRDDKDSDVVDFTGAGRSEFHGHSLKGFVLALRKRGDKFTAYVKDPTEDDYKKSPEKDMENVESSGKILVGIQIHAPPNEENPFDTWFDVEKVSIKQNSGTDNSALEDPPTLYDNFVLDKLTLNPNDNQSSSNPASVKFPFDDMRTNGFTFAEKQINLRAKDMGFQVGTKKNQLLFYNTTVSDDEFEASVQVSNLQQVNGSTPIGACVMLMIRQDKTSMESQFFAVALTSKKELRMLSQETNKNVLSNIEMNNASGHVIGSTAMLKVKKVGSTFTAYFDDTVLGSKDLSTLSGKVHIGVGLTSFNSKLLCV